MYGGRQPIVRQLPYARVTADRRCVPRPPYNEDKDAKETAAVNKSTKKQAQRNCPYALSCLAPARDAANKSLLLGKLLVNSQPKIGRHDIHMLHDIGQLMLIGYAVFHFQEETNADRKSALCSLKLLYHQRHAIVYTLVCNKEIFHGTAELRHISFLTAVVCIANASEIEENLTVYTPSLSGLHALPILKRTAH